MIVYRVLKEPVVFQLSHTGEPVWGVLAQFLDEDDEDTKDYILFDSEDSAWKFFHESQRSFNPIRIEDESNSD